MSTSDIRPWNPKPYNSKECAPKRLKRHTLQRQLSSFFWWLNLVRLYSLDKRLYPKVSIEAYSIMGTIIISSNKILLNWNTLGPKFCKDQSWALKGLNGRLYPNMYTPNKAPDPKLLKPSTLNPEHPEPTKNNPKPQKKKN